METPYLPFRLILASGSLGRRELLKLHGYSFDVKPANIDEPTEARLGDIRHYVGELAFLKAAAVASTVSDGVVIAADTVGWLDGKVVGKPDDEAHARRILQWLSGRVHELWSGVCLWIRPGDFQIAWQERSLVEMAKLSEADIESYLKSRKWEGCSGAYSIQMPDDPYLKVVAGSASNVIGLPMESLARALGWAGRMTVPPVDL
jgi:septum formation protein